MVPELGRQAMRAPGHQSQGHAHSRAVQGIDGVGAVDFHDSPLSAGLRFADAYFHFMNDFNLLRRPGWALEKRAAIVFHRPAGDFTAYGGHVCVYVATRYHRERAAKQGSP
jgi:hypothetical protein